MPPLTPQSPSPEVFRAPFTGLTGEGRGGLAGGEGGPPLPCLSCNNCNGNTSKSGAYLTGSQKKTAHLVYETAGALVRRFGVDRAGFLTLTFPKAIKDAKMAQRAFHSFKTGILDRHWKGRWMRVLERHESGGIHYHLLVVADQDIRSGFNFDHFKKTGRALGANKALRGEWKFLREKCSKYGFGRHRLEPLRSPNPEAIARYCGKYISKHMGQRIDIDKGVRLLSVGKGCKVGSVKFMFYGKTDREGKWTPLASTALWRRQMGIWSEKLGIPESEWNAMAGKNWAFHYRELITMTDPGDCSLAQRLHWGQAMANLFPDGSTEQKFRRKFQAQERTLLLRAEAWKSRSDFGSNGKAYFIKREEKTNGLFSKNHQRGNVAGRGGIVRHCAGLPDRSLQAEGISQGAGRLRQLHCGPDTLQSSRQNPISLTVCDSSPEPLQAQGRGKNAHTSQASALPSPDSKQKLDT